MKKKSNLPLIYSDTEKLSNPYSYIGGVFAYGELYKLLGRSDFIVPEKEKKRLRFGVHYIKVYRHYNTYNCISFLWINTMMKNRRGLIVLETDTEGLECAIKHYKEKSSLI